MKLTDNNSLRFTSIILAVIGLVLISNVGTALATTSNFTTNNVDFNGDGRADVALFDSRAAQWHTYDFYSGVINPIEFGSSGDRQAIGDYDGDGVSDMAICYDDLNTGNKFWRIAYSMSESSDDLPWGTLGDMPVPADYDGDGKTDLAVFRPSTSSWYIFLSKRLSLRIEKFGTESDKLVPADYDGDGQADIAFMRPSESTWYIRYSRNNFDAAISWDVMSVTDDVMVPADYDGDGIDDMAVYRVATGYWTILESMSGNYRNAQFGNEAYTGDQTESLPTGDNADIPMPGDYDGDGIMDLAVWSMKSRVANVLPSQSSHLTSIPVGNRDSRPVSLRVVSQPEDWNR